MAIGPWVLHNAFLEYEGDGTVDLDNDAFVVRLYSSASNVVDETIEDASTLTNELSTANGYTSGGIALTQSLSRVGAVVTFSFSNVAFPVTTAPLVFRYAAIIDTTVAPDLVVAHMIFDDTPADVSVAVDANFVLRFPSGLYVKTKGG